MNDRALLPGEFALLGLLRLRPMHGYEMARELDESGLALVCPIEQSMLYTYIRNLEERGLVAWHEERVGNRPPRKVFTLTRGGRTGLDSWLGEPVERMRSVRREFLIKLWILHNTNQEAERALVRRQVVACTEYLAATRERGAGASGFPALVARSKESAAVATRNWLIDYARQLESEAARA